MDNNMDNTQVVKKKRGRKPKIKVTEHEDDKVIENKDSDTTELTNENKPLPKKRGRKPKGGKIVNIEPKIEQNEIVKQNVILHLKCNLKDIFETNQPDIEPHNENLNNSKISLLNYHTIQNNEKTYNTFDIKDSNYEKNGVDNIIIERETSSSKDINVKLKELQSLLHNNDISDKKSACFWCTYSFDNPPICIPKYKVNNNYQVYGCFCSPECATSYLYNENIDTSIKFERYQLINYIYSKVYNYKQNIKPAPNPYYLLDKYFGNLTIGEYRKLLRNDRLLMVIDKPLTRIFPELHEETNNFMMTTQNDTSSSGIYKVKKKSNNPVTKNSIVNENFGSSTAISVSS